MKRKKISKKVKADRLQKQLQIMREPPTTINGRITVQCVGSFKKKYLELKRKGEDFTMLLKPNYTKFDIEGKAVYTYNKKGFNFKFLAMLSKIKAEIRKNVAAMGGVNALPMFTHKNIRYCLYGKSLTLRMPNAGEVIEYKDAAEYDISKAYFHFAHVLGYISKDLFDACTDEKVVPKKDRLKLLGAIATQGELFTFKNGEEIDSEVVTSELMRRVWFHICKVVDNCMMEFTGAVAGGLYMYWVDGIVFKKSYLKQAKSFAMYAAIKYDCEFHKVRVDKIEVKRNGRGQLCIYVHKETGIKEFLFPTGKK